MRPRLGFLGAGWIGRHRMRAIAEAGVADLVAVADADPSVAKDAADDVGAIAVDPLALTGDDHALDGLVIATPSALHAEQATAALRCGLAVFCQKPLGRTAAECEAVIAAARAADRLLGVDLSYRFVEGAQRMRDVISSGGIGTPYAADLVFHNAYGPDKAWFLDPQLSGGGCLIDLGTHLIDLGLWMIDRPDVEAVTARLFRDGRPLDPPLREVEDHAIVRVDLAGGATLGVACSWFLPAGRDAVIEATFYGTDGAVSLRNVGGSFYDFRAERMRGTDREELAAPPDEWGGRAAIDWARRLGEGRRFDHEVTEVLAVASVIDRVYNR